MGAKTTDKGVSNMSRSVGTIFPMARKILSFMKKTWKSICQCGSIHS